MYTKASTKGLFISISPAEFDSLQIGTSLRLVVHYTREKADTLCYTSPVIMLAYAKKPRRGLPVFVDFQAKNYRELFKISKELRSGSLRASHGDFRGFLYEATVKSMSLAEWSKEKGQNGLLLQFKARINL
jgi:hypothetical protein